jgi:hypothetical protein
MKLVLPMLYLLLICSCAPQLQDKLEPVVMVPTQTKECGISLNIPSIWGEPSKEIENMVVKYFKDVPGGSDIQTCGMYMRKNSDNIIPFLSIIREKTDFPLGDAIFDLVENVNMAPFMHEGQELVSKHINRDKKYIKMLTKDKNRDWLTARYAFFKGSTRTIFLLEGTSKEVNKHLDIMDAIANSVSLSH